MMRIHGVLLGAVVLSMLLVAPAAAQKKDAKPAPKKPVPEVELKFEREVYVYPMDGRRDPFTPLLGRNSTGPRFDELQLRGIIFSPEPTRSVALLVDATGKIHRLRRGDRVGDIRIVEVGQRRVVVSVETFGRSRQEILELKRKGEGETE